MRPRDAANQQQFIQGHLPLQPESFSVPVYAPLSSEEPPPSYADAIRSLNSPLLVGPPPDYGAFRAYFDPDESSEASSEVDDTEQYLPEHIGQAFVVLIFVGMLYGFWRIVNQPDSEGYPGRRLKL